MFLIIHFPGKRPPDTQMSDNQAVRRRVVIFRADYTAADLAQAQKASADTAQNVPEKKP